MKDYLFFLYKIILPLQSFNFGSVTKPKCPPYSWDIQFGTENDCQSHVVRSISTIRDIIILERWLSTVRTMDTKRNIIYIVKR